jgi:uncharacterized secreted protein with C-terminal beta-propeller domain
MITQFQKYLAAPVLLLVVAAGCETTENKRMEIDPVTVNHALTQMKSCEDYVAYAKKTAKQRMKAIVTRNCQSMWDEVDMRDYYYSGGSKGVDVLSADAENSLPPVDGSSSGEDEAASSSDGDYSRTNTQEVGVDEADLVKTDGEHIYVVSGSDLVVVSIDDAGVLSGLGRIALEGRPEELFLYGDTAVVFSALDSDQVPEALLLPPPPENGTNSSDDREMNVAMPEDVDDAPYYYNDGRYTGISVIDLSDKTAPSLVRKSQYAGHYVSSRRIDNAVRAVISSPMYPLEVSTWVYVDYWDMSELQAKSAISSACEDLIESNSKYIDSLTLEDLMPGKYDAETDAVVPIAECSDILGPKTPAGTGLLTVVSMDLDKPAEAQHDISILGQEGQVYASPTALYLTTAGDYVLTAWESGLWEEETSGIHKFDITSDPGKAQYLGSGSAKGRLLNQFSLGEHEGYLRVATTTGSTWWGRDAMKNTLDNHILIFEEQKGALSVVGELSGIGTDEEIYAARFIGDRGFVVTYLQTDPLFTFDLSDPTSPKKVGTWIGPGYSTYLHPFGDDYMIAMGRDEEWRTTVTLYDLSDFGNPTLVEREQLDSDQETAALYEHKAFTFNSETGELLLPYYDWNNRTGVLLYNITESAISLSGALTMSSDVSIEGPTRRAMYNREALIGVSVCRITSAELEDPSQVISSISIYDDVCEIPGWYYYD